ncbi:MAG: cation:proton antiporter [Pseudomonadota bacterium]
MFDPLIIVIALVCGMLSRSVGLPALIGYLAAGFALHELNLGGGELLKILAQTGITLLLFTIGLKLQPSKLLEPAVWATGVVHMALIEGLFVLILFAVATTIPGLELDATGIAVIAFALTFSSTVFVIQVMQDRGELASPHAVLAIGILIIQDIAAVIFLAFSTGKLPTIWALLLLFLLPLRSVILRMLTLCGHGELFTLAGLTLALGGAALFDAVGIKGDLGALLLGAWLAGHQKAKELSQNLLYFKDLFLVCFFLGIGLVGWPTPTMVALAVVLGLLSVLKPLLYFPLMTLFHTPPRTALLSALSLTNYSEFGLIVVAVAASGGLLDPEWAVVLSLAIAVSFIISSPLTRHSHSIYLHWRTFWQGFETGRVRAAKPNTQNIRVMILGMGRVGTGAYDVLAPRYGRGLVGVEQNPGKLEEHRAQQRRVLAADASDPEFWTLIQLDEVEMVMLALTNHEENLLVSELLQELGYHGRLSAVVKFVEEEEELQERGITTFNLYSQAGAGFAAHAMEVAD